MMLSIIYVHYKVEKLIVESIKSIYKYPPKKSFEIIVVDNSNSKLLQRKLSDFEKVKYINPQKNLGFGRACNLGAKKGRGKYLLFINPDTLVRKNSIEKMLEKIQYDKKIGILGPQITDRKGKVLPSISSFLTKVSNIVVYSILNTLWKDNPISKKFWLYDLDRKSEQEVDVVSGACMLIPKDVFDKVKGFDEKFFMYFEEHDICKRVKKKGLKVIYFPEAKIVHYIGQSLKNKKRIRKYFEKSRFLYSKKHFGIPYAILSEFFLRILSADFLIFLTIFLLSLFINTYKLDQLMLFIGDMARDYLVARDFIIYGTIPVVGIPSSVVWLHQGPTSVWLIALSLAVTNFNPIAPAILFGFINAVTSGLVYFLGKNYFNRVTGFISAVLFLSVPLAVVNARMPYHTSLVPFFAVLFFLLLPYEIKSKKTPFLLGLLLGLLLLVELSNIVVVGVLVLVLAIYKQKQSLKRMFVFLLGFLVGILPFTIYDFTNGATYLKFPAWILYRLVRSLTGNSTDDKGLVTDFMPTLYQQISGSILPNLPIASVLIFIAAMILILIKFAKNKKMGDLILTLWIAVPLFGFLAHNSPGTAYFSLLYPAFSLLTGYFLHSAFKLKTAVLLCFIIALLNLNFLFSNSFFVNTNSKNNPMPPTNYSFGNTYLQSKEASMAIIEASKGSEITLKPEGIIKLYKTSLDPYKFFIWRFGGKLSDNGNEYIVSEKGFNTANKIIFQNRTDQVAVHD